MKQPKEQTKQYRMPKTSSELLRWCMEHRDTYPLPPGADPDDIEDDLGDFSVAINVNACFNVTKTFWADWQNVDPSQVSRWINAGCPVRGDGRLNLCEADFWLERYRKNVEYRRMMNWAVE